MTLNECEVEQGELMTVTDDAVTIHYSSASIVTATVVDDYGEWWICRAGSLPWSCDCGDVACIHVMAVRQVTGR